MSQLDHPLSDYAPGCPDELGTSPFVARPMMRPRKQAHGLVLRVILLSIIWPIAMQGAQYYVSTNGSNSNNGSLNSPWQTLQYALGRLSPGDTVASHASPTTGRQQHVTEGFDRKINRLCNRLGHVAMLRPAHRLPGSGPGLWRKNLQAQIWPSRRQSAG